MCVRMVATHLVLEYKNSEHLIMLMYVNIMVIHMHHLFAIVVFFLLLIDVKNKETY